MSTTWINRGHLYSPHVRPVLVDCNFIVDKANGNGLGLRSLKGQGISAAYMTSSSTPAAGNPLVSGVSEGLIVIQFADNFNRAYPGMSSIIPPVATSTKIDNSALTVGQAYVIVTLDSAITQAQWHTLGLPLGVIPAVGATFIAALIGLAGEANTSTARVMLASNSGIDHIETIGNPNTTIWPSPVGGSPGAPAQIILKCVFENAQTQPADGTVIGLCFYMNQSNVIVAGE